MSGDREPAAAPERPLSALSAETQAVYERNAQRFDQERSQVLFEKPWLDRFTHHVAVGGTVLDVGCGSGRPIAAYLRRCGVRVTGVDFSAPMLELAWEHFPEGDWRYGDMRKLDLPERFDGVIGWNGFFHLTPDEQRGTLPRLARHLAPIGVLMLTVGPEAGEVAGRVGDDAVYHSSLSESEYREILEKHGVEILDFVRNDPACQGHTVLLARRLTDNQGVPHVAVPLSPCHPGS